MGNGEALTIKVMDQASQQGAAELFCLAFEDNPAALNLYGKLGFENAVIPELEERLEEEGQVLSRRRVLLRKVLS